MAYLGVWGAMIVLVVIVALIVFCLYKEWTVPALLIGISLIIAIPLWLDSIIFNRWYVAIPWESSRDPEEWMDFLGSYLGVIGTIVAGALAYWQTRVNRKQDKEIERQKGEIDSQRQKMTELQEQITMYQVCPAVYFRNGTMKVYTGDIRQQTNKNMYSQIYYCLRGKPLSDDVSSFVHINIPFQEKGIVPIEKVIIKEIKWSIDNKIYIVKLKDDKYAMMGEQLQALIDCGDDITKEDCGEGRGQDFIDAMIKHQEYYGTGDYNYEKSHLMLKLQFVNQMGRSREYELDYFIYSERSAEQMCLNNPHVSITGEDNK